MKERPGTESVEEAAARFGVGPEGETISAGGVTVTVTFNPAPDADTVAEEEASVGGRRFYVYAHRDSAGRIFYVGKGQDQRAWSTERHDLWHRYVQERLSGQYTVEILKDGLTASEAEWLEARLIAEHGATLVNWDNPSRGFDYEALRQYHARRDANALVVARARKLEDVAPAQAIELYLEALHEERDYESLVLEKGSLVADLVREQPKYCAPDILDRLTLCLVRQGRVEEAREAAAAFFASFPAAAESGRGRAIAKRVASGRAPRASRRTPNDRPSEPQGDFFRPDFIRRASSAREPGRPQRLGIRARASGRHRHRDPLLQGERSR